MGKRIYNGRIIFDHLPKAAGQAINSWLTQELGSGCVTPNLIGAHDELIRQYGGEYSIVSGHIHFDGDGLDPRYQYVTFFREPIDRAISWIFYLVNNVPKTEETRLLIEGAELFLSGDEPTQGFIHSISNPYVEHFSKIVQNALLTNNDKINHALHAIKQYDVIGFYDEMPRFLADFSSLLCIPAPEMIAKVNVTREKPTVNTISPQLRERLSELNGLDIEFYAKLREWYFQQERVETQKITVSPWERYERPSRDRVFSGSEFQLHQAILKEGYDIVHGQALRFEVEFALDREIAELEAGIHIWDTQKRWAFGTNSTLQKQVIRNVSPGIYRISHYVIADLPEGVYMAGFAFAEKLSGGSTHELMWYDKLCEFRVSHSSNRVGVGYANLPATVALTQMGSFEKNLISDGSGRMASMAMPAEMKPSDKINLDVEIHNDTDVVWKGDPFRPINLSYHWLNENDDIILFDGVRTALPDDGVCAHGFALASMEIVTPEKEGKYKLILTMVQESVGWFEEMGFQAYSVEIEVITND